MNYNFERRDDAVGRENGIYYNTPEKIRHPAITTAIKEFYPEKQKFLEEWRNRVGHDEADRISRTARNRGNALHDLIEKYIDDDSDVGKVMPSTMQLIKQIYPLLKEQLGDVYLKESPLWSHKYKLAGRIDALGNWNSVLSTIDWKNSIKPKLEEWVEDYKLQTAAYSFMIQEVYGVEITQNVIVIAVVESNEPQVFISDPRDYLNHPFFQWRLEQ